MGSVIDKQAIEGVDFDVREMRDRLADHFHPFRNGKKRRG
jgi:hypothetical protein